MAPVRHRRRGRKRNIGVTTSRRQRAAKRRKRLPEQLEPQRARSWQWIVFLRSVYLVLFALVSWATSLLAFKPVVKIELSSIDKSHPFRFQVHVENDSTFSIYRVTTIVIANGLIGGVHVQNVGVITQPPEIPEIESSSRPVVFSTVPVAPLAPSGPQTQLDSRLQVIVSFRASWMWWRSVRERWYRPRDLPDGTFEWIETTKA